MCIIITTPSRCEDARQMFGFHVFLYYCHTKKITTHDYIAAAISTYCITLRG